MKSRNGFVSNSSSTSFIIAIDKSKSKQCPHCHCQPPDFLTLMQPEDMLEAPKYFIDRTTDDYNRLKSQHDILAEYSQVFTDAQEDKALAKLIIMAVKLGKSISNFRYPTGEVVTDTDFSEKVWSSASNLGYYSTDISIDEALIQRLKDEQTSLKRYMDKITKSMADKQATISKTAELKGDEWGIVSTTLDNSEHGKQSLINELVERGMAVIISQEYNS